MSDSTNQKSPGFSRPHGIYIHAASLHFCCPALFLTVHPASQNELIALRFGCSERSVRRWRTLDLKCERSESCLLPRFTERLPLEKFKVLMLKVAEAPASNLPTPTEHTERGD